MKRILQKEKGLPNSETEGANLESSLKGPKAMALGLLTLVIFSLFILGDGPFPFRKERCQLVYAFTGGGRIGTPSQGTLVVGTDGALFGTSLDRASIYRLEPEGGVEVLHEFSHDGREGYSPSGGLLATGRMLFGTCSTGGTAGGGTLFRIHESGDGSRVGHYPRDPVPAKLAAPNDEAAAAARNETAEFECLNEATEVSTCEEIVPFKEGHGFMILHDFGAAPNDGWGPIGKLVEGPEKFLFGTTSLGGRFGGGTVYKILPDGSAYTVLHHFGSEPGDGRYPNAGLTVGADSNLYGVTVNGGDHEQGCLYRLAPEGENFEVVYSFGEAPMDGGFPYASLLSIGPVLFGTASGGGKYALGTIFRLNTEDLQYKVVHHFNGGDGVFPQAELVDGPDGCLYGTTPAGGEFVGTLYRFNPSVGRVQVLHKFAGWYHRSEGASPFAGVVMHQGVLYGSTKEGGERGLGTIFRYPL